MHICDANKQQQRNKQNKTTFADTLFIMQHKTNLTITVTFPQGQAHVHDYVTVNKGQSYFTVRVLNFVVYKYSWNLWYAPYP